MLPRFRHSRRGRAAGQGRPRRDRRFRPDPGALEARTLLSTLPEGFIEAEVVTGLAFPTAMQIGPEGEIYVAEQFTGNVRVIRDGRLLPEPIVSVDASAIGGDTGLFGLTFDPDFLRGGDGHEGHEHEHFLYLHYTSDEGQARNRVSRFPVVDGQVLADREEVIFELDPLVGTNHHGGALRFGPDGKLYVSVGDGFSPNRSQRLDSLFGKVLRLNPDGSIPPDNPFVGQATGKYQAIWALGLRNPFQMEFHPQTGELYINDVGAGNWEEINVGLAGGNFGWPESEGPTDDLRFSSPLFSYPHSPEQSELWGCAVVGADFYLPETPQFPGEYLGNYFFADICNGIRALDLASGQARMFASDMPSPVDVKVADDGSLYYLSLTNTEHLTAPTPNTGSVYRISFAEDGPPAILRPPAGVAVEAGRPATFAVVPTGPAPYSFQWLRDGREIPGATEASYTLDGTTIEDDGARFQAVVRNRFGEVTSAPASLTVSPFPAPSISFLSPSPTDRYVAGREYRFEARAVSGEGTPIPAESITSWINFHHDEHFHPFRPPIAGQASGSFQIPDIGETDDNVWFRIHVTATDRFGLTSEESFDLFPMKSEVRLETDPPGLGLLLDDSPISTPTAFVGVAGLRRTLGAPPIQSVGGVPYAFQNWSDGGPIRHTVATPEADSTFTAVYRPLGQGGRSPGATPSGADFDGDGKADLTVFRPESDLLPGASHWFVELSGGGTISQPFGKAGDDVPVPADFDGDGKADLAVFRPNSDLVPGAAHWFVILSGGGVINQPFGKAGDDVPVPADFDGDGKADLAVFRPNSDLVPGAAHWFALFSSGGAGSRALSNSGGAVPVPVDYDGDGRASFAQFLPSTAEWTIDRPGQEPEVVVFGSPGEDLPVPADYDGDGRIDLGAVRTKGPLWFYRSSADAGLVFLTSPAQSDVVVVQPLLARRRDLADGSNPYRWTLGT
jgi:glucose/arabinose dehydrogenase